MDDLMKTLKEVVEIAEALRDHLDYCGWGDSLESECADAAITKGNAAIERAKGG